MRIGSLFSGIGGLELGLEWAGLGEVVWQVEISPFCRRILEKHWPKAARYEDVRGFEGTSVDLICGGFPCQDVSQAARGRNRGLEGEKSGLWYEFQRIVGAVQPYVVVVENVQSGAARWLPQVREGLGCLGYRTRAYGISATVCGAPHARKRVFVVAYADRDRQPTLPQHGEVARPPQDAAAMWNGWVAEPGTLRMAHGVSAELDRLKALGNAVVPQCAEVIGRIIRRDLMLLRNSI